LCYSKSGLEARIKKLESVLDKATSLVHQHHSQQLITSILHDAESHNWSDEKEYFEVISCVFLCDVFVSVILKILERKQKVPV